MTETLPDVGHKPHIKMEAGEVVRIGWPTAIAYVPTEGPDKGKELPWPPGYDTHPGKPVPIPLSSRVTAKMIALGEIGPLPRSVNYRIVEKDLEAVRALQATGWLADPRHSGRKGKFVDNRTAPGA